jgi:hypothetical protein
MIQRTGEVVIRMRADVKQKTIGPLIRATIAPGSTVSTDEYDIDARLPEWGYAHRTACHGAGEYARDDDGDGFCEVHVNTMEGFWSLLRTPSASRPSGRCAGPTAYGAPSVAVPGPPRTATTTPSPSGNATSATAAASGSTT